MINIEKKTRCSGCGACAAVCPKNAIRMKSDSEGFRYPIVNKNRCVNCQRCDRVCPIINFEKNHGERLVKYKSAYAYRSDNSEKRWISSSGGCFYELAVSWINNGGIVVGAAFLEDYTVAHVIVKDKDDLIPLMGSKYLQSNIENVYLPIKRALISGKKVLFFGMTCQIEGVKAFVGLDEEGLYCVDLICMGVPSPLVWKIYLNTFFNKSMIQSINFKEKSDGWHDFSFFAKLKDGSEFRENGFDNPFFECMFKSYSIRPSCFKCKFKSESKLSDLTIADCWGCESYASEIDDNKGLSMVIIHSDKGRELFDSIKDNGKSLQFDYNNVLKYNSNYDTCTEIRGNRKAFFWLLKRSPKLAFRIYGKNPRKSFFAKVMRKIGL